MVWKTKFEEYEKSKNWQGVLQLLERITEKDQDFVEAHVRLIYLLLSIITELEYPTIEPNKCPIENHATLVSLLKYYFDLSYQKFSCNPEFLFFMGAKMCYAEPHVNVDRNFAIDMQKRASELEPTNILYRWSYLTHILPHKNKKVALELTRYMCEDSSKEKEWLLTKGQPGKEILDCLRGSYESYLCKLAMNKYVLVQYIALLSDFLNGGVPKELFKQYYAEMITKENCMFQEKTSFIFQELSKNIGAQANEPALRQKVSEALEGLKNIQASF